MKIEKKYILVLAKDSTNGLDDTTITAEAKYYVNINKSRKKTCLNQYYNGANSFLYANGVQIQQFTVRFLKKTTSIIIFQSITCKNSGLDGKVYNFSVNYETISVIDIEDIYKYLMKKSQYFINV